jgi:hypothetical protein
MDGTELMTVGWAFEAQSLVVDVAAINRGRCEVLLLDRLWTRDAMGELAWDRAGAYRFADKGSLRLFFGPAPLLPDMSVADPQFPCLTKLAPGEEVRRRVEIAVPITEYNPFFRADPERASHAPMRADHLDVLMNYVVRDEGVKTRPSPIDPEVLSLAAYPYVMHLAHTRTATAPFQVLRRTDEIARVTLPGE